jgi:hypothetical protein
MDDILWTILFILGKNLVVMNIFAYDFLIPNHFLVTHMLCISFLEKYNNIEALC